MKTLSFLVVLVATSAAAQLELPAPSPAASVKQVVGLTDVSLEYSSPAVKGRKIWGDLVPYDKPWRTGANAPTKVTFSRDVTFGGKPVPKGSYALVTHPTAKGWTVALSKNLERAYDPKEDVVRVPATSSVIPNRERLAFIFSNTTETDTSLDLEWEKLRVSVPIKVATAEHAAANIKAALEETWETPMRVAQYTARTTKDLNTALKYADTSIAVHSHWLNNWAKADLLAQMNNFADARKHAQISWDLGQKDPDFYLKDQVTKALAAWKTK